MCDIVLIEKIAIDSDGILSVKPRKESFDMIYRTANGVRWNSEHKYLYFNAPVTQKNDVLEFYNLIVKAVSEEYGKKLKPDDKTIFVNINKNVF